MNNDIRISIVIPAFNEEKTIGICVTKALKALRQLRGEAAGEVVVADNGSTDATARIAEQLGARVVNVRRKGYGRALMEGFRAARGKYLIMADADDSYNFEETAPFFHKLKEGYDLVMGNRFKGKIEKGAMPFLHRYLGTPVLTGLSNLFFKTNIGDVNCGMRGLTKEAFNKMELKAGGMEFATEMIVKASLLKLKIAEIPCNLYRDKRDHSPYLNTWQDGWRHLRFMLLFTATWTFFIPGLVLVLGGLLGMFLLSLRDIFQAGFLPFITQKHMLSFLLLFLMGCQIVQLGFIAKAFSFSKRFDHANAVIRFLSKRFRLERGILCGLLLILLSILVIAYLAVSFFSSLVPYLTDPVRLDMAIFAIAFFLLGIQLIFTSFVLSLFYIKVK